MISEVKRVVLVLSGKGGVGKSTVATQLALTLTNNKLKVGLLDIDLCGPSIPRMLNLEECHVQQTNEGWLPVSVDGCPLLSVMSIGFLLKGKDSAVIWRGPKKNAMIRQFITDVNWGSLDYLIVDTPPGTSDEHISVVECLKEYRTPDGAILVTTPQDLSIGDVRREITFCRKANINIIGLIENMSGYVCPHCSECTNIFSSGGGESLAKYADIRFLAKIPIDTKLGECTDDGIDFINNFNDSQTANIFDNMAQFEP
ncbi:cytosolic Fe-S cluster assembly factor NUBP2-like [Oppia nitens]|uniref:cytosolic Fe-S cluster assembly factor NUBP2-like n=1 Tax=Oppia nitens TaxID=1686743 RepID=UPI0023DB1790|nr:cytosolic Fe-S cluster assembly factor NUBP2-like [Oppia nitens]